MAQGPRVGVKPSSARPVRPPTPLASVALTGITGRVTAHGKESWPPSQALVVAEPPRVVGGRVALAPQLRFAFQGRRFVSSPLRPRRKGGLRQPPSLRAPTSPTPRAEGPGVAPGEARLGVDVEGPFGVATGGVADVPNVGPGPRVAAGPRPVG